VSALWRRFEPVLKSCPGIVVIWRVPRSDFSQITLCPEKIVAIMKTGFKFVSEFSGNGRSRKPAGEEAERKIEIVFFLFVVLELFGTIIN
jgi:hypothetical protein